MHLPPPQLGPPLAPPASTAVLCSPKGVLAAQVIKVTFYAFGLFMLPVCLCGEHSAKAIERWIRRAWAGESEADSSSSNNNNSNSNSTRTVLKWKTIGSGAATALSMANLGLTSARMACEATKAKVSIAGMSVELALGMAVAVTALVKLGLEWMALVAAEKAAKKKAKEDEEEESIVRPPLAEQWRRDRRVASDNVVSAERLAPWA
ncbi:hypothetical protein LTR85_008703 [Meristemomyces frigidus]|nr:hypothetical protein LTR85_008703 [Meristemomyces frigidus]